VLAIRDQFAVEHRVNSERGGLGRELNLLRAKLKPRLHIRARDCQHNTSCKLAGYTIRTADGGGLTRVTSNPGGVDIPGDYAPNGKRLVFARVDHPTDPAALGLYVVKVGHNRLRQITPPGTLVGESGGDWSPQGNEIVFSQRVTPDALSSIWAVHADGTGLHEVPVQAQPACGGASSDPSSQGCFEPRWSPDGKKIVFARGTSAGQDSNICTVNADGTDLTQVTHGGTDQSPDWGTHPLSG
jgi:Tol biopolymer transport system component